MTRPPVLERREGAIAVVTLNRPEALNALDLEMRDLLPRVLNGLNADDTVRAVVLTGAGERAFSAGQDLNDSASFDEKTVQEHFLHLGALYQSVRALEKPVVVALNGLAAGFGLQTALHADIRIAHPGVRMGQPEVRAGIPSTVGPFIIERVVGHARAVELSLTGRLVDAETCLAWGMVNEIVPREQVMPRAMELAGELAALPPLAVRLTKRRLLERTQAEYDETVQAAMRYQHAAYSDGEPQRVAAAFFQERAARRKRETA